MAELSGKFNLFPYDGGFDATKHPVLLDPKDLVEMDNIIYTTYASKRLRPGISALFGNPRPYGNQPIISGIDYHRNGFGQRIIFFDNSRIRAVDLDGNTVDITPPDLSLNDVNVSFTVFSGLLIAFFPGTSYKPYYWTGTGGMTEISEAPEGAPFGRVWVNSLWTTDPAVSGRILKSETGNPLNFTTADAEEFDLDINDGDPDGVTAMFPPTFQKFYISKRLSIYEGSYIYDGVTGSFIFQFIKISDGIGCISHQAVASVEDVIIFPSDRGIHTLSQSDKVSGVETNFLTKDIQPLWVSDINFSRSQYMRGVYDNTRNCYLLAYPNPGRSYSTSVWGFSLYTGRWFLWSEYGQTCLFRYISSATRKIEIGCGGSDGSFGKIDDEVTSDFGVKYGAFMQTGIIIPGGQLRNSFQLTRMAPIYVPQDKGTFYISYKINGRQVERIDFEQNVDLDSVALGEDFITGQTPLGSYPQVVMDSVETKGHGEFFQFTIEYVPDSDPDDNSRFELLGISLGLIPTSPTSGKVAG